jgi:collagenase-like PrtC family protease
MTVNFSIPAILDKNFPIALKDEFVTNSLESDINRIGNVYGSLPRNIVGHARSPGSIPDVDMDFLAEYIMQMAEMNIAFHYTINTPWSGGFERTEAGQRKIIEELSELVKIGVKAFIISNPYLIKFVRQNFSSVGVIASTNMRSDSVPLIESLLSLGADSVVLNKKLNRDFTMLRELSLKFGDKITLLVNSTCLWECPLYDYHSLETGFISQNIGNDEKLELLDPDFCLDYCVDRFIDEPWNLIRSQWIIPEYIDFYHQMGIMNFKIQGRTLNTKDMTKLVRGYHERKTPGGDLFGIWPGFKDVLISRTKKRNESLKLERIPVETIVESGFLDNIKLSNQPCSLGCSECTLCHSVYSMTQKTGKKTNESNMKN